MPGFLSRAETSIPESSENETAFTIFEREPAFLYAFSMKLLPFSLTEKPFGAPLIRMFFKGHILLISFSLSLFDDAK